MIVTDYEAWLQEPPKRQGRELRLTPVPSDKRIPPQLTGDMRFSAQVMDTYGAGYRGAVLNEGSKFEYGLAGTGSGNVFDIPFLLQNARTAYTESLLARAVVDRYADTVIDVGLKLLPTPKSEILGISPERAEKWADNVAQRFDCWFDSKKCMLNEVDNGYQLQRQVEIYTRRDGEYFIRFHYSGRQDLINPLQLSVVDPTQILGYGAVDTHGFNRTYADGIERDLGGKEVAYHVMVLTEKGYQQRRIPAIGPRSKRRFMLHGYSPLYPGQGRGISALAHALQDFSNITDFSQAQILKAISQSQFNFKTVPSDKAPASNPLETNAGFNNAYGTTAQTTTSNGEVSRMVYSQLPEVWQSVPGSVGMFGLQAGEDFEAVQNSAPVEQFASFVEAFSTYLTASESMPIEVLLMKFGRSYTASMGALILFWRVAEIGRHEHKRDWLDYVYEAWLSEEIAAGRIRAPGWSDPLMRSAWLSNRWGGAPMPIIDPSKQSKADKDYVEIGAQTLDDVARNYNGSDGRLNRAKLARQVPEITPVPWAKGGGGGANPDNPETEGEED
jgi:capsid protein